MAGKRATTRGPAINGKSNGAPGRPSKNTPENKRKLVEAITIGCTHKLACQMVGISEQSLADWRRADSDFHDAITEAAGACERSLVAIVQTAARGTPARAASGNNPAVTAVQGDWKAAAFILERKWPESWGRRFNLEHTGKGGGAIQHEVTQVANYDHMSSDQQIQLFELLALAEAGQVGGANDGA